MEENESEEETEDGNQLKKMMKSKALFCLYQRILSQENNTVSVEILTRIKFSIFTKILSIKF